MAFFLGCLFNDTTSLPAGQSVWNKLYSASARSPPLLEFHGTADPTVPFANAAARGGPNNTDGKRNQVRKRGGGAAGPLFT